MLGANKNIAKIFNEIEFSDKAVFYAENKTSNKFWNFLEIIWLSIFNTNSKIIPLKSKANVFIKLFPFLGKKLKINFSKDNLSTTLIN